MKHIVILIGFSFSALLSTAEVKVETEKIEMKTYYVVFLKKGENRNQDSVTVAELQK